MKRTKKIIEYVYKGEINKLKPLITSNLKKALKKFIQKLFQNN